MVYAQCKEKAGRYYIKAETKPTGMLICYENHQHIDESQYQPHKAVIAVIPFLHYTILIVNCQLSILLQHVHPHALSLVEEHEINTNNHQRNAQQLSHIEGHALLEIHLIFLQKLDEEAESENSCEAKSEEETTLIGFQLFIEHNHHDEQHEISYSFIELCRMARHHIHPFEDESPRHICRLTDNL